VGQAKTTTERTSPDEAKVAIAYLFRTAGILGMPIHNTKGEKPGSVRGQGLDH